MGGKEKRVRFGLPGADGAGVLFELGSSFGDESLRRAMKACMKWLF